MALSEFALIERYFRAGGSARKDVLTGLLFMGFAAFGQMAKTCGGKCFLVAPVPTSLLTVPAT